MNDQPTLTPDLEGFGDPIETISEYIYLHLRCQVPTCNYSVTYGKGFEDHDYARKTFHDTHTAQHVPGKTPDLRHLTIKYSGWCTNCGASFGYESFDPNDDRIWCESCPASWTTMGWDGRTDLEREE